MADEPEEDAESVENVEIVEYVEEGRASTEDAAEVEAAEVTDVEHDDDQDEEEAPTILEEPKLDKKQEELIEEDKSVKIKKEKTKKGKDKKGKTKSVKTEIVSEAGDTIAEDVEEEEKKIKKGKKGKDKKGKEKEKTKEKEKRKDAAVAEELATVDRPSEAETAPPKESKDQIEQEVPVGKDKGKKGKKVKEAKRKSKEETTLVEVEVKTEQDVKEKQKKMEYEVVVEDPRDSRVASVQILTIEDMQKTVDVDSKGLSMDSKSQICSEAVLSPKLEEGSSSSSSEYFKTRGKSTAQVGPTKIKSMMSSKKSKAKKAKKKLSQMSEKTEIDSSIIKIAKIVEEVITKKEGKKTKKGPKPKKMTAEMMEKQKELEENAAKKAREEEKLKQHAEIEAGNRNQKREIFEQQIRLEHLGLSNTLRDEIREFNIKLESEEDERNEWETYIKCGWLPSGSYCDDLTTYIYLWNEVMETTTVEEASKRTSDVLEILDDIDDSMIKIGTTKDSKSNMVWARQLLRDCQKKSLDVTTYMLLRFVETKMIRVNMNVSEFHFQDENVKFSIWLRKRLPIPLPNPRRPPKPRIEISFTNLNLSVLCPTSLDGEGFAIRAMYLGYDHYSDICESATMPEMSDLFNIDLFSYTQREWRAKMKYKYDNRVRAHKVIQIEDENGELVDTTVEEEDLEIGPNDPIPEVPYRKLTPTPNGFVLEIEENLYKENRKHMYRDLPENVVNLRQYTILGGIYKVDLLKQPPQPQDFILINMYITTLYLPKELEYMPFFIEYTSPEPPEEGVIRTPEEIEEDMKKTEEDMDKLILITLKWPDHVLFLDLPFICFWDPEKQYWTREDVFDLKHVEESGTLSFRSRRFGTFALGNLRFSHLPFQTWELKPEEDGTATLQITSAVLMFEFNIKESLVSLAQLQNCPNNALKNIIGTYFKLHVLIKHMKEAGMDIFPSFDAFCYIEGVCEKHWHTETHTYRNMAQMYNSFNFSWSRWNAVQGMRSIVMQMREYTPNKYKQKNFSTMLITPLKASFIECTEVSPTFVEDEPEGIKFCADLYQLMKATSNIYVRTAVQNGNKQCIYTLRRLLMYTRLHSFS